MRILLTAALALVAAVAVARAASEAAAPLLPDEPFSYAVRSPPDLAGFDLSAEALRSSDAGATLGRVLFYDRNLSANGLVSCGSCHKQAAGFSDRTRFSLGFTGRVTRRAAMALANARYNPRGRYFWDERAASLADQVLQPFTDPVEMGLAGGELVARVSGRDWYRPLFAQAFGDDGIDEPRIAAALAQFVRAIVADGSRYDVARRQASSADEPFSAFTAAENRGKTLFRTPRRAGGAGCAACHETDAFIMARPRNNGLDAGPGAADRGLAETTGREADAGLFRAPSLKNVAITPPYMHDGRFADLEAVLDHYATGVQPHPNLSPELREPDGAPARLSLTAADRRDLIAFLGTLTDVSLLDDPRFSDPFAP